MPEPLETSGIDELRRQTLEAMGEMVHRMSPEVMVARMVSGQVWMCMEDWEDK